MENFWTDIGAKLCFPSCLKTMVDMKYAVKLPDNDQSNVSLKVKSILEEKLIKKGIRLQENTLEESLNGTVTKLVFCVLSSRIGADIDCSIKGLTGAETMLVLLHYKLKSQVTGDLADEEHLLEDSFHIKLRDENRITHFAFHDRDGGLYEHPQNHKGMEKLVNFFCEKAE